MLNFRIKVPGVTEYTGIFAGQQQAALDAERRYPGAMPASTFLLPSYSESGVFAPGQIIEIPANTVLFPSYPPAIQRTAPDQQFAPGVGSSRSYTRPRRAHASGLTVARWGLAAAVAIILSASYLLDGPTKNHTAQDLAEAEYAAAVADGGVAKCAAVGRTPKWTADGSLICRKSQRLAVAQGSQP